MGFDRAEQGRIPMAEKSPAPPADHDIPFMQKLLDNPFILLFLGVTMPTVLYIVWGIIEVANIPIAN
jgi:hypothetical protein